MVCPSLFDPDYHMYEDMPGDESQVEQIHTRFRDSYLAQKLNVISDKNVLRHFYGFPIFGAPSVLHEAAIVCLNASWWQKEPFPTTEFGIAELMVKGLTPTIHAGNILGGMRVAHARIIPNAHLQNYYSDSGDPEQFNFGLTKFVTTQEAKEILINTFVRVRTVGNDSGALQPIILVGHAVDNFLEHIKHSFGVDLHSYSTIVKIIDTQNLAKQASIHSSKGPNISLQHLLEYFKIRINNLHTAGNDAAGTLIAAVLTALKDDIYMYGVPQAVVVNRDIQDVIEHLQALGKSLPAPPWGREKFCTRCDRENHVRTVCRAMVHCLTCENSGVAKLFKARKTHTTSRCLYRYLELHPKDYGR